MVGEYIGGGVALVIKTLNLVSIMDCMTVCAMEKFPFAVSKNDLQK